VYTAIQVKSNKHVDASSARRGDGPFRCPNPECKARVGLRKGSERTAYFAHLSHQAKPDCYAYSGPQLSVSQPRGVQNGAESVLNNSRIRVGFVGDSQKSYTVVLEIPRANPNCWWKGKLLLRTPRGEFKLGHAQLQVEARLRVGPASSYQFEREVPGNIDGAYWSLVCEPIEVLNHSDWTIFRDGIGIGSRLDEGFPLAWGESYWGIAIGNREEQLLQMTGVEVLSIERWESDWWVHRFLIKNCEQALDADVSLAIFACFGRRLVQPRPRAYVVTPAPHHIALNGTWFIAGPCDRVEIRITSRIAVELHAADGQLAYSLDASNGNIAIENPPTGRFAVTFANDTLLTVEIGEAAVVTAPGIRVEYQDQNVDLLQLQDALSNTANLGKDTLFTFRLP